MSPLRSPATGVRSSALRRGMVAALAGVTLSACGGGTTENETLPAVASVSVTPSAQTLIAGTTSQFTATPKDAQGGALAGRAVVWSSTAVAVATVSTSGLVSAVSPGTVQVRATSEGVYGEATVTVTPAPVSTVSLSSAAGTLVPNGSLTLTAVPRDAQGNPLVGRVVDWTTSASGIATVSPGGLVTAVAVGTATITATSEGKSASAAITVRDGGFIGAAGGTVTAAAGNVTVQVPAQALATATALTVAPVTNPQADPKLIPGTAYDLGPPGTSFGQPVTLRIKYDLASVPTGGNPSQFRVHRLAGTTWTVLAGSSVDVPTRTVTGQTNSFSTYAVLEVAPPPAIALNPASLTFTATQGGADPTSQVTTITNSGGGTLSGLAVGTTTYGVGEPMGWLTTATFNATTAPATLTVRPTIGALPAGSYHAKVPITSSAAGNSPQDVMVTLTVTPASAASFIVFQRYTGTLLLIPASAEIWRMDPSGGNQIQLTNDPTFDGEPDLSPDRQSIVFSSNRNNGGPHLFRMKADGSGVTQLTISSTISVLDQRHGRWAPSGLQSVIYQDRVQTGSISHYDVREVNALAVSDSGSPRVIGTLNTEQPAWSPNGVDFVWAGSNTLFSGHLIYRTVPNGFIALRNVRDANSPNWSPDGLRIVFDEYTIGAGGLPNATQIWVMDAADGGNPVQLTTTGTNFAPYWSPDGTKIVFTRYDGSQYDLWVMDANGGNQVNLTNTPGSHETWASWR